MLPVTAVNRQEEGGFKHTMSKKKEQKTNKKGEKNEQIFRKKKKRETLSQ